MLSLAPIAYGTRWQCCHAWTLYKKSWLRWCRKRAWCVHIIAIKCAWRHEPFRLVLCTFHEDITFKIRCETCEMDACEEEEARGTCSLWQHNHEHPTTSLIHCFTTLLVPKHVSGAYRSRNQKHLARGKHRGGWQEKLCFNNLNSMSPAQVKLDYIWKRIGCFSGCALS